MAAFQDHVLLGDRVDQPTPGDVPIGALYYVTDEGLLERSNGTIWEAYSIAGGAGDIRADGTVDFAADQSMGGFKLTDVDDPANPQDAATKAYVDAITASINIGSAVVLADEVQASNTAYGDLATVGPSVTLTITGTELLIGFSASVNHGAAGNSAFMSIAVSGSTTIAAHHDNAAIVSGTGAGFDMSAARFVKLTGLTPGSITITAKYSNNGGGTWTFGRRTMFVLEMP